MRIDFGHVSFRFKSFCSLFCSMAALGEVLELVANDANDSADQANHGGPGCAFDEVLELVANDSANHGGPDCAFDEVLALVAEPLQSRGFEFYFQTCL